MRLDKAIGHAGHGSRRDIAAWAKAGRICVDGVVCKNAAVAVDPLTQSVTLDGQDIDYQEFYHIILHKPQGYVSSTEDPRDKTVLELLDERHRRMAPFPVGRLDKDSTGLLLLTTDGALAHRLLAPSKHVDKVYYVTVDGLLRPDMVGRFAVGVTLGDGTLCRPAGLEILSLTEARVTLREGKYHQIKRMMAACGVTVTALHRHSMGSLMLPEDLEPGAWRRVAKLPELVLDGPPE